MDNTNFNDHLKEIRMFLIVIISLLMIIAITSVYTAYKYYQTTRWQTPVYDTVSMLLLKKDFSGLLEYSEKILKSDPNEYNALYGKAVALYNLKRWEEAEEAFIIVRERRPSYANRIDRYLRIIRQKIEAGNGK